MICLVHTIFQQQTILLEIHTGNMFVEEIHTKYHLVVHSFHDIEHVEPMICLEWAYF